MSVNIKRAIAGIDWTPDPLEFFDDEASPINLEDYTGRLRLKTVAGALVVDSTSAPRVVVATSRTVTYRALGADIASSGTYIYWLEYTDAAGVPHVGDHGILYVDQGPT